MVYYSAPLDRTFAALSDPTRRALLAQLEAQDAVSISELARPFAMSLPAVMKHLDVLTDAGLITRAKSGRTVTCRLNAAPMQEAMQWLNKYERFWTERYKPRGWRCMQCHPPDHLPAEAVTISPAR